MLSPKALAQGAFLRLEAVLNRVLGERMNPLYYLGAIAYFQLWIVVASGLYLYVFFETSVTAAHASVEALTHGQRWAGGILRSLHRYASDGMVLAMLLHMLRHFVFGHHRGFRDRGVRHQRGLDFLLAAPWLGRRAGSAARFAVSVHPDERIVTARRGETILEAGLREGLPMPFDCRNE